MFEVIRCFRLVLGYQVLGYQVDLHIINHLIQLLIYSPRPHYVINFASLTKSFIMLLFTRVTLLTVQ